MRTYVLPLSVLSKAKVSLFSYRVAHFAQKQTAGFDRAGGWIKRRQAACNLVRVVEALTFHFMRKKFFGESGFTGTVQPAMR